MAEFKLNEKVDSLIKKKPDIVYNKDKQILDICKVLTEKGYVTKASCEEHPNKIKFWIDESKNICVFYEAYILFCNKYDFSSLPKYWAEEVDRAKYIFNNKSDENAYHENFYKIKTNINNKPTSSIKDSTIKIRKASKEEIDEFYNGKEKTFKIDKLSDSDKIIDKFEQFKKSYLSPLKSWVESLPKIDDDKKSLNEATTLSDNALKRKQITDFIVEMYDALEKGGTKNSTKFINQTKSMTDSQFIAYMSSIVNDPKKHLYFEIEAFENEPDYETVEYVANDIVGEKYTHLYDYIAFPHLSDDPKKPVYTVHKVFNGYINMRRVQQLVNNKNHIPTSTAKRDPKTNQVTFESKAARISDAEQFALICHGTKNVLKEFYGPRGGDPVMRDEMVHQIATTGSAQLYDMHDSKLNKTSLNTANVYLTASAIESDLVTKNGILPRTIMNQYREARRLDRSNVR